jgi:hypothetical protein
MITEILSGAEIILIAVGAYFLSQVVGTNSTNNDLTKTLTPTIAILCGIVLVHTLLWYMYFTYNPISMNLYFMVSGSMTMIISLVALSISLTSRS